MNLYLSYIDPLTSWLNQHPHWAGIITFLISFSESLAIVGSLVPGSVTMTAIGMLIGTSVIPGIPIFIWAVLGAIAGDSASYFLGFYYHEKINEYWPFKKYPQMLKSGRVFFNSHGGKSVFLGRFLGPLRSIIPMVAGMVHMPHSSFLFANISSAILWSLLYILPGILIGTAASELSPHLATTFFLYTLLALTAIWIFSLLLKYIYIKGTNFIDNHLKSFWCWMNKHPRLNAVAELISNPKHPHDHSQITLLLTALFFFISFIIIAISAHNRGIVTLWDKQVFYFLQSIRLPITDIVLMMFTYIADKKNIMVLLFGIFFYLLYKEKKWEAIHWLSNGIFSALSVYALKIFINLPRPTGLIQIRHGSSFPSGHTTFSIAVFGFLFYLIAKNTSKEMRRFIYIPGALLLFFIAFSRLYLGMHWLSDVIGSVFLSSSILFIHILSYKRSEIEKINIKKVMAIASLLTLMTNAFFMYYGFNASLQGSQPKHIHSLSHFSNWWAGKEILATHRQNRFGIDVSPLNIQWAMPLNKIKHSLSKNGWKVPKDINTSGRFKTLLLSKENRLSLFNKLYNNQPPALLMINGTKIIRLWSHPLTFIHNKTPLWIGTLSYIDKERSSILTKKINSQMKTQENYIPSQLLGKVLQGLDIKKIKGGKLKEILLIKSKL